MPSVENPAMPSPVTDVAHSAAHTEAHNAFFLAAGGDGGISSCLAVACLCMLLSTVAFNFMAKEGTKRFNYVAMAVTGIATMAYCAMWCGAGISVVDGRNVYWMRYVDWFFTTPFFLLDLALLASADKWDTFYVMLLNAICIASGAIGSMNPDARMPMFIFGMITFAAFNAKLFGAMMSKASTLGENVAGKYKQVTTLTMLVWCAYPVMYLLCEVSGIFSEFAEVASYAVLDVVAKCVCGYILLQNEATLNEVNSGMEKGYGPLA